MSEKKSSGKVSAKPPSGFRDFVGEAATKRQNLMEQISKIYRSFGFESLETPALENLDVLLGSGGQENEKLIFKALKRGEKLEQAIQSGASEDLADLGLRFDLTVPLCRVFAANRAQIHLPWKVFHLGPVWRAERPQKGRYREFVQCDVDVVGSRSLMAEVEVIQAVASAFLKLGVEGLCLRLNHRELLTSLGKSFGFSDRLGDFVILLDKKDKMPIEQLEAEMQALLGSALPLDLQKLLKDEVSLDELESFHPEAVAELKQLLVFCKELALPVQIQFDPSLARGMGYYTGSIFEFTLADSAQALGGGGRYDQLIGRFSSQDVPAVGCSIGFERLLLYLEDKKKRFGLAERLFVPVFESSLYLKTQTLASEIRAEGFSVDVFCEDAKLKNQLRYASSKSYRWVLMAGSEEFQAGLFKLKDMQEGSEIQIPRSELKTKLKSLGLGVL